MRRLGFILLCPLVLALAGAPRAQEQAAPSAPASRPGPAGLQWPRDRDRPVATLAGKEITLGSLIEALEQDYAPGSGEIFAGPAGSRTLDASLPLLAWLQLDLMLARETARARSIALTREEIDAEIRKRFQKHMTELTWKDPTREAALRANQGHLFRVFRRTAGPRAEIDLLLEKMAPKQFTAAELRDFYQENGRRSEMRAKVAHIFIPRLDQATGRLPDPEGVARREELLRDIKARLAPDGSNFAEIARRFSALPETARLGGELGLVPRWSERYPAITRAAFALRQGEWTGPVEEPDGFHFVKNLKFVGRGAVYVPTQIRDELTDDMARQKREDLLLALRGEARARLLL